MITPTILIKPMITEKSMSDVSSGKFTFAVAKNATKNQIRKVVEKQFQVHVVAVATSIIKGKSKRVSVNRRQNVVKESAWKKAIVKLIKGEKISAFDISGKE